MLDNKLDILVLLRESNDPRPPARVTTRGAGISDRGLRRVPKYAKEVVIDFEGIHDRIQRIRLAGSERDLVWSPDGTQLGFTHSAGAGKRAGL